MIYDFATQSEVLKVTIPNLVKLFIMSYIFFILLPRFIFPQIGIKTKIDRILFNIIYMTATIETFIPLLVFLKIYSYITLFLSFLFLKVLFIILFEKKNPYLTLRNNFSIFLIKTLNYLDRIYNNFFTGKYKKIRTLNLKIIANFNTICILLIVLFVIYAIIDINYINFCSLNNKTSDVSQFIEWVGNLHKNILYADRKTGGADFFGLPILVFFLQVITHIDSVILFSLYPTLIFLFMSFGLFYVIYKLTDSVYSGFITFIFFVVIILSPLSLYLTGKTFTTNNPEILNLGSFKIYLPFIKYFAKKKMLSSLNNIDYILFIRMNSGLAYEISASFFVLNIYFLIMSLWKKENIYILLFALTLYLVFVFHGGVAFILVIVNSLIFLNGLIFREITFSILKKGAIAIILPAIFGNFWMFSWLKYGIPQDFGNAAPILDKFFKTKTYTEKVVETGKEFVDLIVFYTNQLIYYLIFCLLYFFSLFFYKEKRFFASSLSLVFIGVLIIYFSQNLGLPKVVSASRCVDFLLISFALSFGIFFGLFDKFLKKILKKAYKYVMLSSISVVSLTCVFLLPTYNSTDYFYEFTSSIQYNSVALALYKIKNSREPYTYTIVGFVQSYPKVFDKGFHINAQNFIKRYNPYAPELQIDTKYIYIIVETVPLKYSGRGEWYYRWRKDIELSLMTWIKIYSKFHNNIRLYYSNDYVEIYEIDNREYYRKIMLERLKKKKWRE